MSAQQFVTPDDFLVWRTNLVGYIETANDKQRIMLTKLIDERHAALVERIDDFQEEVDLRFEASDEKIASLWQEFAALRQEFVAFREETQQRFQQIDQRLTTVEKEVRALRGEIRNLTHLVMAIIKHLGIDVMRTEQNDS